MTIQEKRLYLRELSAKAKQIKEQLIEDAKTPAQALEASSLRINDIIIKYFYKTPLHQEFNTFKGWLKEGFCVQKGQKAFLVWGRPKGVQDREQGKDTAEDETTDFYPLSFIFSNAQVEPIKEKSNA